jgi:hypothetical protein
MPLPWRREIPFGFSKEITISRPIRHRAIIRSTSVFSVITVATVLNLDALTGWVGIRGMRTQGGSGTGWITPRYIVATRPNGGGNPGTDGHINWCPVKGAVQPHASGRLRLATWNLANLHSQNGQSIFSDSEKRHDIDYERIRCYVRLMDPDILAVQEVDGAAA